MSSPGWGLHNFDLALRRWKRTSNPSDELVAQVKNWRSAVEMQGLVALEPWAVISEDDDFVARIPGTQVVVSGTLLPYEELVIIQKFEGVG